MTMRLGISFMSNSPNTGGWKDRHIAAITRPRASESPIVAMLDGWLDYAECHEARFESRIGDDYVLGPQWAAIGAAIRGLLNGELGRLDAGTLDTIIYRTLAAEGFDPDTL